MATSTTYYQSIDEMPIFNWFRCHEGRLEYVVKSGEIIDNAECNIAFIKIYDEYLKKIGVGAKYLEYLKIQNRITEENCNYVITRNRKILNKIDQLEAKLLGMEAMNGAPMSPEKTIMYLSKWLGFKINQKETTVTEYFTCIEEYRNQSKSK